MKIDIKEHLLEGKSFEEAKTTLDQNEEDLKENIRRALYKKNYKRAYKLMHKLKLYKNRIIESSMFIEDEFWLAFEVPKASLDLMVKMRGYGKTTIDRKGG